MAPTRTRYLILGLLCLLAMNTYMDRAVIGSAQSYITADLNIPHEDFFIALMAFQIAYGLFEIPTGWLGDTRGPRSTLLRIVLWWSLFVALTGCVGLSIGGVYLGFTALILIRFLFGMGEAGAFPNITKALYNWFPATDRGTAKSAIWMSARLVGGLTPLIWVALTAFAGLSWREVHWLFAGLAIAWCALFYVGFTNTPAEHSRVNDAERALIDAGKAPPVVHRVPWGKMLRSRNLLLLGLMYIVTNFCWYFLMYYLPDEMRRQFKERTATDSGKALVAFLAGSPLLIGMFGCLLGGLWSDAIIRRTGNRTWGRRLPGMVSYGGAGLCYFAAALAIAYDRDNLFLFAGCLILMGFFNDLNMAPAWATCQDIGQRYAGIVSGTMNTFGNLIGAVAGIYAVGLIRKHYPGDDGLQICFALFGTVYLVGVLIWSRIDAAKPIESEPEPHS